MCCTGDLDLYDELFERFDLTEPERDEDEHGCEALGCKNDGSDFYESAGMRLCEPCWKVWNE